MAIRLRLIRICLCLIRVYMSTSDAEEGGERERYKSRHHGTPLPERSPRRYEAFGVGTLRRPGPRADMIRWTHPPIGGSAPIGGSEQLRRAAVKIAAQHARANWPPASRKRDQ